MLAFNDVFIISAKAATAESSDDKPAPGLSCLFSFSRAFSIAFNSSTASFVVRRSSSSSSDFDFDFDFVDFDNV